MKYPSEIKLKTLVDNLCLKKTSPSSLLFLTLLFLGNIIGMLEGRVVENLTSVHIGCSLLSVFVFLFLIVASPSH